MTKNNLLKIFIFLVITLIFYSIFTIFTKTDFYILQWYKIYIWTIIWFFWLFPFNFLENFSSWNFNEITKNFYFYNFFNLYFKNKIIIILNLSFYFIFYYLFFKENIKKYIFEKKFSKNSKINKIIKIIYLIISYFIYLKIFVIISSLLLTKNIYL